MRHNILNTLKVLVLATVLSFGLSYVYAWTAPTQNPPGGNVFAPINTSATAQTKAGDFTIQGTIITNALKIMNGAGLNKILISDVNGNALWQAGGGMPGQVLTLDASGSPTWQKPATGCGGGQYIADIVAGNTLHGTYTSTTGASQTVSIPAGVQAFVLQGAGNSGNGAGGGGGASYAKTTSAWLVVAGGGGGGGRWTNPADANIWGFGVDGYGGNFGVKFGDGTFGQMAATGGGAGPGFSGNTGSGGNGGQAPVGGGAGCSGGAGPAGNGSTGCSPWWPAYDGKGGYGNAGAGGAAGFSMMVMGGGGGGGGYGGGGGGGAGGSYVAGGGGGGGGYMNPNRLWVCEGGVYFLTSYTGQSITIGSSAGGSGGFVRLIY